MSKSLYEIDANLQAIINDVEEAGGEVTDEQLEALRIGQEELEEKLDNYRKAYLSITADIDFAKTEKKRIDAWKHSRELTAERLKSNMLDAVLTYGKDGKSGNKTIDVAGGKLFTKNVYSIQVNQDVWRHVKLIVLDKLKELWSNGMLDADDNCGYLQPIDAESFVNVINAEYKAQYPEEAAQLEETRGHLVTLNDLLLMSVTVEFDVTLSNLLKVDKYDILNAIFNHNECCIVVDNPDKTYIKEQLKYDKETIVIDECITPSLNIK